MKVGTKSVLFGVHQFLWHPLTVGLAWRRLYRKWPTWKEWVCIFCHDLGYWGCADIDGKEGSRHPVAGAFIAAAILTQIQRTRLFFKCPRLWFRSRLYRYTVRIAGSLGHWEHFKLVRHHSRTMAALDGFPISPLCWPDKYCVLCEPRWFYLLRGTLSGEIKEFRANAKPISFTSSRAWLNWYRNKVKALPGIQEHLSHIDFVKESGTSPSE